MASKIGRNLVKLLPTTGERQGNAGIFFFGYRPSVRIHNLLQIVRNSSVIFLFLLEYMCVLRRDSEETDGIALA